MASSFEPRFSIARRFRRTELIVDFHGERYGYGHILLGLFHGARFAADARVALALRFPPGSPYSLEPGITWKGVRQWPRWLPQPVGQPLGESVPGAAAALGISSASVWTIPCPPIEFPPSFVRSAEARARGLGIAPDEPVVTWHCREAGFGGGSKEDARNNDPRSFLPALDLLHARGVRVVRLGDPTMTPIEHPALVDYGRSPVQSLSMDLWLAGRARFMIGSDSGPSLLARVTNTPMLMVGACASHRYQFCARVLVKPVFDETSGRALTRAEQETAGLRSAASVQKANRAEGRSRYRFLAIHPGEIVEAVADMIGRSPAVPG